MADSSDWEFVYVLPNLVLPDDPAENVTGEWPGGIDLNTDVLSVVPSSDDRLQVIREATPVVGQILDSFFTSQGARYRPAVLIVRQSAPESVRRSEEAIVAFRNAIALSVVLRGRAAAAQGYGGMSPTWSDTFDFHPAQVSGRGRFVVLSPALRSLIARDDPLHFTDSPYLPREGRRVWPDAYLYRTLGIEWGRRYNGSRPKAQFGRSLFRSLEVAYQACAVGAKNQGSIHDYGVQVALWVSAIEILSWPEERHASFTHALKLLKRAPLHGKLQKKRYRAKMKKKGSALRMNALERAYSYLYKSRNRFLHGNPVSSSLLFTRNQTTDPAPIPRVAAVVYRAALTAYLRERHPVEIESLEEVRVRGDELGLGMTYDSALAEYFSINLEDT